VEVSDPHRDPVSSVHGLVWRSMMKRMTAGGPKIGLMAVRKPGA